MRETGRTPCSLVILCMLTAGLAAAYDTTGTGAFAGRITGADPGRVEWQF